MITSRIETFRARGLLLVVLAATPSCTSSDEAGPFSPAAPGATAGGPSGGTVGAGAAGSSNAGMAMSGRGPGGASGAASGGSAGAAGASGDRAGGAGTAGSAGSTAGATDPGTEGDGDFTVSDFTAPPGIPGAPEGFFSEGDINVSGSDLAPGNHAVQVFIPSQYVDGSEAPFMIVADGIPGLSGDVLMNTVRNRAAATDERRTPALVLIGVTPGSNRSVEYDTVSERYLRFINTAVIPAVVAHEAITSRYPNFKLTSRPERRGVYGCSSGGSAAMAMAWFGDFTRVMSFSGSFVSLQRTPPDYPNGAWDYPRIIRDSPVKPGLRVFMHVGEDDFDRGGMENWIAGNDNLAEELAARGYHYRFVTASNSGHCDGRAIRAILPDALTWLWRGYAPN